MTEVPQRAPLWSELRKPLATSDVVGLGEISIDEVGRLAASSEEGDKIALVSLERQPGGTIATTLLGCARLGLRATLLGAVGEDPEARQALAPLAEAEIHLEGVSRMQGTATRKAFIVVEPDSGKRTVYSLRSDGLNLDPGRLNPEVIRDTRLVLLDVSDPAASEWAASVARAAGIPVVLDADRPWPQPERLLSQVDFPIVTEELAKTFSPGGADAAKGVEILARHGARLAVMTQGARGSLALGTGGWIDTPAFPSRVVDSTGAGDAFRAGFAFGLLQGTDASRLLTLANAAGGLNCERAGAQPGLPTRTELATRLEEGAAS
jgi:sugar/nucleoside kinase (ribokinase family)